MAYIFTGVPRPGRKRSAMARWLSMTMLSTGVAGAAVVAPANPVSAQAQQRTYARSEEHTSELQSH